MRRTLALVLPIAALLVASPPGAGAATVATADVVRDCHTYAYYPNILISSVRNMRCHRAKRDMRSRNAPISRRFTTPFGFRCKRVSGSRLGGQWRCVKGERAYRFDFGD